MSAESTFGMIAKNRRRELGLTQDELARRVGCAPITLRKIEADDLRPSVQIAERMAMALNIPLEERAAFVKLARVDRTPIEEPKVTPMPSPEEIGTEDLSGRAIRGYALGERLGNGGMGVVYRAVQPLVEREVAIKIVLPQYANHPDFIRRFEAEAQLVARLEHPHIVPLYDYWREPGVAYLIMRLLRGGSVHSLLQNGSILAPETILRLMEQVGSALSSAHRAGVVHRDLKPANVLLDEDNNAYLADFGIAKNLSSPSSDTQADMVVGSLDYISPEQIRSEYIRPQTDIYALGVMLYELFTGKVPFHGPTPFDVMRQHISTPLPPLAANRIGLPKSLDAVIEHATAKDPLQRYENVDMMLYDLRMALGGDLQEIKAKEISSRSTLLPLTEMDNPYKGLRAFVEGDAQDFYGREALIQQLLIRLGEGGELSHFLAVVGPSGSGKSSVVKAGLIPALRRGALPGSENWFIIEMMPSSHPLEELEAALLRVAVNPPASLIEQFEKDGRGLIRAVRRSLPDDPNIELVLVIDQFEEVFTLVQDEAERLRFLGLLVTAILDENSRIRVVLTLRADFIDRPLGYVDFGELMHQRMEIVLPLTADELESTIVSPAERVGLQLEHGLVSSILRDLGDQPGTLPLLQYALTELYEKREGNTLTKSAYQTIGGVLGALGRRAEEIFTGLDAECQEIAKQLFLRLVTLGEGVEDTRRRALVFELENLQFGNTVDTRSFSRSFQKVLDAFGRARLLSFDRDPDTRGPTVEVAHEAIIREWARLRKWLEESRTQVRMQRQLSTAASEWMDAHRDTSFLLTGTKLAQYEGWTASSAVALTQHELDYLKASTYARDQREMEEAERQKRELEAAQKLAETERRSVVNLRMRNRVITIIGTIALILALLAGTFGVRSNQNELRAEANFKQAEAQRLALEANRLILSQGSPEQIALLTVQSMKTQHTSEGDAVLAAASRLNHPRQLYAGHSDFITSVAYSPDGKYVLTSSSDKTARLWDARTGKEMHQFIHTDGVDIVAFSPDGFYILTSSFDGITRLWDTISGKELRQFEGGEARYSPDSKTVLTTRDNSVRLWDATTGQKRKEFTTPENTEIFYPVISPDGKYLLAGDSAGIAHLWDLQTNQEVQKFTGHTSIVFWVAFSPDEKFILTGSYDATARLWDISTGKELQRFTHTNNVLCVAFSPDGKYIFTGSADNTARLWNAQSGQELGRFTSPAPIFSISVSPDGNLLLTGGADGVARLWDIKPKIELPSFNYNAVISAVAFSPDGKSVLTGGNGGIARLWDAISGQKLYEFTGHTDLINYGVAFSPDGKHILTGSIDKSIRLWDIQTGKEIYKLVEDRGVQSVAFSPDGKYIATATSGAARLWNSETGEKVRDFSGVDLGIYRVTFSPNGQYVAVASDDGAILFEVSSGHLIRQFIGQTSLHSVAFSPDGKYLVTGGAGDQNAWLWDVNTGQNLRQFIGHTDIVWNATFSPDGNFVATASGDGTARLWDVQTGQELRRFIGHTAGVEGVAFSPDGKYLLTGSDDGTALLWDVDYHTTINYLCSVLLRDFTDEERAQYGITDNTPTCPQNQNSLSAP